VLQALHAEQVHHGAVHSATIIGRLARKVVKNMRQEQRGHGVSILVAAWLQHTQRAGLDEKGEVDKRLAAPWGHGPQQRCRVAKALEVLEVPLAHNVWQRVHDLVHHGWLVLYPAHIEFAALLREAVDLDMLVHPRHRPI
jgi:hypothetical protein